jgi:hypothetical protein
MPNSLFTEITPKASETVSGGFNFANFDFSSYAARVGAGAVFGGGVTAAVIDSAFQGSVSSRQAVLIGYTYPTTVQYGDRNGQYTFAPGSTVPLSLLRFNLGGGTPVYG